MSRLQDCRIETTVIVGPQSYHLGLIDILQEWNLKKQCVQEDNNMRQVSCVVGRLELFFKAFILGKEKDGITVQDPEWYQERLMARLHEIMTSGQTDGE